MKKSGGMPMVDYRGFRFHKLNTPEFAHLKYLAFWPVFGLFFFGVERIWVQEQYYPIHCALDDWIPLCEFFLIPYLFWFIFLAGIHLYTLLFDLNAFRKMMQFIILTFSVTILIYFLFPTCQELRPPEFVRDNPFTRFLAGFYEFDTSTNVCPSLHVIGSVAVMLGAWNCRGLDTPARRAVICIITLLISVSTVFLKQHSVVDVLCAVPVCLAAGILVYGKKRGKAPDC